MEELSQKEYSMTYINENKGFETKSFGIKTIVCADGELKSFCQVKRNGKVVVENTNHRIALEQFEKLSLDE